MKHEKDIAQKFVSVLPARWLPRWLPFLIWTLFVGVLLAVVLCFRSIGNMNVETDFYWTYVPVAKALLAGKLVLDNFRGPGYEIALALFRLLIGDFFKAGMILSVCSAGITLLMLYGVVKRTFDPDTALLVAAGTAILPAFFSLGYTAGTDMFFVMLAFSVLYLIIRSDFTHSWFLLLAGVLSGYTYLTRYNGIAIILAAGTSILWLCDPSVPWKQRIRSACVFLSGAAVTIVPFSLYTHHVTGRFSYNDNFLNVAYEVYGRGRIQWDDYWQAIAPHFRSYADVMAYDPMKFLQHIGLNVFRYGWNDLTMLVPWPVGLGAVVGGTAMVQSGLTRKQAAVLLFAVLSFLVLLPVFYTERFALLLLPFVVLFFARFLQWRAFRGVPERGHRYAATAVALGVAAWACFLCVDGTRFDIATEPVEILKVRDAFSGLTTDNPRGTSISARKPHIAHYLDLEYVPFPYVSSEADLVTALRQAKADYVYISTYEIVTRPELKDLLNSTKDHQGLRPLISVISPPSVLYRVTP
jgi:hypothetical protein